MRYLSRRKPVILSSQYEPVCEPDERISQKQSLLKFEWYVAELSLHGFYRFICVFYGFYLASLEFA